MLEKQAHSCFLKYTTSCLAFVCSHVYIEMIDCPFVLQCMQCMFQSYYYPHHQHSTIWIREVENKHLGVEKRCWMPGDEQAHTSLSEINILLLYACVCKCTNWFGRLICHHRLCRIGQVLQHWSINGLKMIRMRETPYIEMGHY